MLLFDKTGTLTEGNPRVEEMVTMDGINELEVLAQEASVECNATHPLARAVLQAAHYARLTVTAAQNLVTETGLGVCGICGGSLIEVGSAYLRGGSAQVPAALQPRLQAAQARGATPLLVFRDKKPVGFLSVSDRVRANACQTVQRLRGLGIESAGILSGDHQQSVDLVGRQVGITQWWARLQPSGKLAIIRDLQKTGASVLYVGDGINDAPALAIAGVGVAMGAKGTEVALETAGIALMSDDIGKLPFLIALGRRMLLVIQGNIAFGLFFNLIAVVAGFSGLISPVMGALMHNIGSVLVMLSSASLAFFREPGATSRPVRLRTP